MNIWFGEWFWTDSVLHVTFSFFCFVLLFLLLLLFLLGRSQELRIASYCCCDHCACNDRNVEKCENLLSYCNMYKWIQDGSILPSVQRFRVCGMEFLCGEPKLVQYAKGFRCNFCWWELEGRCVITNGTVCFPAILGQRTSNYCCFCQLTMVHFLCLGEVVVGVPTHDPTLLFSRRFLVIERNSVPDLVCLACKSLRVLSEL